MQTKYNTTNEKSLIGLVFDVKILYSIIWDSIDHMVAIILTLSIICNKWNVFCY